jgi:hypothetical protein
MFRLVVGALGSALCLMPFVGMARAVGLIGLPPHGNELIGDLVFLVIALTIVVGAIRAGWRAGRDDDCGHGGGEGGGEEDAHEGPLFTDFGPR